MGKFAPFIGVPMLSIAFYILFILFTLVFFLFFSVVWLVTMPFDHDRAVLHWISRLWTKCYFGIIPGWKLRVDGLENIERDKSYVVTVNHRSMVDIILMYVLPFNFKWVAKKEVYNWPIFGWVMRMHRDITIERGTAAGMRRMIRTGGKWLGRGVSVIIFPEGSRGKVDGVGKFHEGAFMLAKESGSAILPCVSTGTGNVMNGRKVNFRNTYRIRILPPVPAEEVAATPVKEMTRRMQQYTARQYEILKKSDNERSS